MTPQLLITADREETKYLVTQHEKRALVAALNEHLPAHRHRGEGANTLPGPEHFVTTVYFDTPSLAHFRAAQRDSQHHVKLRAKEYYDVHPSLAELATDVAEVLHRSPFVWLELKRRAGARSQKQRVRLERRAVTDWLAGRGGTYEAAGDAAIIQGYLASLAEPLSPCSVVNYRRSSWQAPDDDLRVTIDADIAFFASVPEVWTLSSLARGTLGRPLHRESNLLVEVKHRNDGPPAWLERTLQAARAKAVAYSKFMRATESVQGHA